MCQMVLSRKSVLAPNLGNGHSICSQQTLCSLTGPQGVSAVAVTNKFHTEQQQRLAEQLAMRNDCMLCARTKSDQKCTKEGKQ